ncbi:MAG: DUF3592 domain-containing protein [Acidobacteria bacterium]|nr:DUF3592 domain-containing protein [Acidobacteriota bacterium]
MTMSASRRDDLKGMGCLILFGLPFAAVGTFMGWLIASTLWRSYEMRSWVEVPAKILEADLESHTGDDSTTYSVAARYRYVYQGQSYESDRISLHAGADNVGHYHQRLAGVLESHRRSGEPYRCYVDPADPARAILDRDPRWGLVGFYSIFFLTFGGVGWGMIVGGLLAVRRRPKLGSQEAERRADAERPWLHRDDWAEGLVRYSDRRPALGMLVFALLWNLISSPILFVLPEELDKGNYPALLGLLFPLVGAGLVIWVVRGMLRWRRYGESTLFLDRVPVPVGGVLEGRVEIDSRVEPPDGFAWTLSCVEKPQRRSNRSSNTERVQWQDSGHLPYERHGVLSARTVVPIRLDLPAGERPTSREADDETVVWRLKLEADVEGIDYLGIFELPVYQLAATSIAGDLPAPDEFREELPPPPAAETLRTEDLETFGIEVRPLPGGGRRFRQPMARQPGTALSLTLFWLVWNAALVFMVRLGAPWPFPLIFGLFSLLITYSMLDFWFGASDIEADAQGLRLKTTILGVGRRVEIPADEVGSVEVEKGMQSGSKLFYRVAVRTASGKKYAAATRIPGRRPALALKRALEKALEG